ncbi:MAG: Co2+/Mg2+ efflux protein ApaG [Nitratireductor sp.]|nr:Co2+/Mg2+ efflux protein ApaG [Nitratireductor sp.]
MYQAETNSIRIEVTPQYVEGRSDPSRSRFFWAYRVVIENAREDTVQLVSRYWQITDSLGKVEEVRGAGVIGEQPVLGPGDRFEYTSGCPLPTPSGFMRGSYTFVDETGDRFEAVIPAFSLDLPGMQHVIN